MDRKIIVQIEERINARSGRGMLRKVDPELRNAVDTALNSRVDCGVDTSFYSYLCGELKKRGFVKKSGLLDEGGFYDYAQISSNTWSNIRWNKGTPSKETLRKLVFALKMNEEDATELLRRGHDAFDETDPRDRVLLALIDIRCYDIYKVYEVLEEYGQHGKQPFRNLYIFTE